MGQNIVSRGAHLGNKTIVKDIESDSLKVRIVIACRGMSGMGHPHGAFGLGATFSFLT